MIEHGEKVMTTIINPLKARQYERTTLERKLKQVDDSDSDDSIGNKKLEKKLKKYRSKLDSVHK